MNSGLDDSVCHSPPYVCLPHTEMELRAYGSAVEDLDIDFKSASQPHIAAAVLHACLSSQSRKLSYETVWGFSLSQRMQALLSLVIITHGKQLNLHINCSSNECGEMFELPLDLSLFQQERNKSDEYVEFAAAEDRVLQLRLPNGYDQLKWQQCDDTVDPAMMATDLLVSINGEQLNSPASNAMINAEWLEDISELLEQHDRLTALQLQTGCPVCNRAMQIDLDLEYHLLQVLAVCQKQLLFEIHQLAQVYHWNEADILSLTAQRRRYYLNLIDEGAWS